ncbi:MAG: histidine--tRNA ligase [Holosporales bacterium]
MRIPLNFQPVRGTRDWLPESTKRYRALIDLALETAYAYGFEEVMTPIFEFSGVFHRLGETSDVVSKETYTFTDRGGEEITLRPEGTAGVMRAIISDGLTQSGPHKFFYHGPMFRYDRPQRGRLRQFHQIGVELIGVAQPLADIEVIALANDLLAALGLEEVVQLHLNTLGDLESREAYREALVRYFTPLKNKLSEESQLRLLRNPLRILDSKDEGDRALMAGVPVFSDFLNQGSRDFFARVAEGLDQLGIPYTYDPHLVRGLDYYCHTAFEFVTDALGAQGTVLAGGRYDGLSKALGGPELPGIGWAAGVERLLELAEATFEDDPLRLALIPLGDEAETLALRLAHALRQHGLWTDLGYSGNMGKRMKRADKLQADFAIILGEDELRLGQAVVRNLHSGEQIGVAFDGLVPYFLDLMSDL